jgi:hypothetical protein
MLYAFDHNFSVKGGMVALPKGPAGEVRMVLGYLGVGFFSQSHCTACLAEITFLLLYNSFSLCLPPSQHWALNSEPRPWSFCS